MTTRCSSKESGPRRKTANGLLIVTIVGLLFTTTGCGPRQYPTPYQQVSHSSHDAEMFNNRGNGYVLKHEYKAAVHSYTEAIQLDRNFADAYCNRGSVYVQKGGPDLAITDLDEAIRLKPDFGRAFYVRGEAWEQKGDATKAKEDFDRAKQLGFDPDVRR